MKYKAILKAKAQEALYCLANFFSGQLLLDRWKRKMILKKRKLVNQKLKSELSGKALEGTRYCYHVAKREKKPEAWKSLDVKLARLYDWASYSYFSTPNVDDVTSAMHSDLILSYLEECQKEYEEKTPRQKWEAQTAYNALNERAMEDTEEFLKTVYNANDPFCLGKAPKQFKDAKLWDDIGATCTDVLSVALYGKAAKLPKSTTPAEKLGYLIATKVCDWYKFPSLYEQTLGDSLRL